MSGRGQEAHPEVREGLGGPPEGLKRVGSLWESVPEVLDGSRGPSGGPGEVGSPPVGQGGVRRTTEMSRKPTQRSG